MSAKTTLTFAQIKALKAAQAAGAQSPPPSNVVPKSPRSMLLIDARPLSPRPLERVQETDAELEVELKHIEREHKLVQDALKEAEKASVNEEKARALREEVAKRRQLEKDLKYAQLEVKFAKERVEQVIFFGIFFFFFSKLFSKGSSAQAQARAAVVERGRQWSED